MRLLEAVDVAGSPARASDERVIRGAVSAGATLCRAALRRALGGDHLGRWRPGDRAGAGGHVGAHGGGSRRRPQARAATVGQPVSVTLRWTAGGWRIQREAVGDGAQACPTSHCAAASTVSCSKVNPEAVRTLGVTRRLPRMSLENSPR